MPGLLDRIKQAAAEGGASERTDSVKSLLNNITAGFRYTGNF